MSKISRWLLFLLLVSPFVFFSCCLGPYIPKTPLPQGKILDMHVHGAGIGAGDSGCFLSSYLRESYKFDIYLSAFGVTVEELKKHGDGLIIKKIAEKLSQSKHVGAAVILAMDGVVDDQGQLDREKTQVYVPNDFIACEVAKYDNLYLGASINPQRSDALERLDRVAQQGAKLIKWIPAIQLFDPSDQALIPFYEKLIEYDFPLLTHTGNERSFGEAIDSLGDPKRLELPLSLGVKVIAAHVATTGESEGVDNVERLMPLFKKYPNLYSDISSLTQINKLFYLSKILKRTDVHDRLLYGTDFPLISTALVSPLYFSHRLTLSQVTELMSIDNPWDQDVALKHALGVPQEMFERSGELLRITINNKLK